MFLDRQDAGRRLCHTVLQRYAGQSGVLVLGLPRGGTVVAAEVARGLHLPLETWVARKIGAPGQPEYGLGALSHLDTIVWDHDALERLGLLPADLTEEVRHQRGELARRLATFRHAEEPPDVEGRTVILVDDGLATGVTAHAAVGALRKAGAQHIVLALPVAPLQTLNELRALVDDLVVLHATERLDGVGLWYDDFHQATDAEVLRAMAAAPKAEGTA